MEMKKTIKLDCEEVKEIIEKKMSEKLGYQIEIIDFVCSQYGFRATIKWT